MVFYIPFQSFIYSYAVLLRSKCEPFFAQVITIGGFGIKKSRANMLDLSACVFGSFVTGKYNVDGGVDLLVDFDPKQTSYDDFMDLSFFLEDLLGASRNGMEKNVEYQK